eukprot:TRINITY_DN3989_c0_g1_i1.p1 TRINITY_DN3989_c0_g1~~TRINITY_DN3989_c0_g1_i1.p1  ORF type:complete len:147 (-),score=37.41 TRINITY_DN3989_c0_g1_i1:27-467(-)
MDDFETKRSGFFLRSLHMRDAECGDVLWEESWEGTEAFEQEIRVQVPKRILQVSAVSRELTFSSASLMENFRAVQTVYLDDMPIEEWNFPFGFVIPGSTNTWETVLEADTGNMLPAEVVSGHIWIVTQFFDGEEMLQECKARVYYV